jgi:hypothetical protein
MFFDDDCSPGVLITVGLIKSKMKKTAFNRRTKITEAFFY